ncbi:MAG: hypothetical protein PVJ42_00740, partial [bacterium]
MFRRETESGKSVCRSACKSVCTSVCKSVCSSVSVFASVALVCLAVMGCSEKADRSGLAAHLPDPDAVPGVAGMGEIAEYEGETLYDFLNGGAEIYFEYGISSIASAEYRTASDRGIEVSIYDMGSDAAAFGIYSNVRYAGADFVDVGNEGMLTMSSLDFWKGRYYCRLLTFDMEAETQAVMIDLGNALAANIKEAGSVPAIVGLLPEEGLVARSEKVFRGPIGLNNIRYMSSENVFNLSGNTQGVAAGYEIDEMAYAVFVIEYVTEEEASAAYE